jgi:multidrug resistance efflux pump
MTTTVSLFDYDQIDLTADPGVTPGAPVRTVDPDQAQRRLDEARHQLLVAESAHRSAVVRAETSWMRSLPPTLGRRGAARIEEIHGNLDDARRRGRRPWAAAARGEARRLQIEEQLTLERYGFARYEEFARRDAAPAKPEVAEPATVRRARKAVARAEADLQSAALRASA